MIGARATVAAGDSDDDARRRDDPVVGAENPRAEPIQACRDRT